MQHFPPVLLLEGPEDFCNGSVKHKWTITSPSSHQHPRKHLLCAHQHPGGHLTPAFQVRPASARLCRLVFVCSEVFFCLSSTHPMSEWSSKAFFTSICVVAACMQDAILQPRQPCCLLPCLLSCPPSSSSFFTSNMNSPDENSKTSGQT